jgi:hypothetical protein
MPERGPLGPGDYKTIEPVEDGWTLEDLNEVLYVNGYEVDMPFTLEDIHWDREPIEVEYDERRGLVFAVLMEADDRSCINVIAEADENNSISGTSKIYNIDYYLGDKLINMNSIEYSDFLIINGVSLCDSFDMMIENMGSNYQDGTAIQYKLDNTEDNLFYFTFNDENDTDRINNILINIDTN